MLHHKYEKIFLKIILTKIAPSQLKIITISEGKEIKLLRDSYTQFHVKYSVNLHLNGTIYICYHAKLQKTHIYAVFE